MKTYRKPNEQLYSHWNLSTPPGITVISLSIDLSHNYSVRGVRLYGKAFINLLVSNYTHGNKLGNTFSPWGKTELIHFPFFLAILKFLSHIYHTFA